MNDEILLKRNCEAVLIPAGTKVTLQAGEPVLITQALGGSYTVIINGNLARIEARDADALGQSPAPLTPSTPSDPSDPSDSSDSSDPSALPGRGFRSRGVAGNAANLAGCAPCWGLFYPSNKALCAELPCFGAKTPWHVLC